MTESEQEPTEGRDREVYEFFGRRSHWDVLMLMNLLLVGTTSVQLWSVQSAPGERPFTFYIYLLSLAFYVFAFFWMARASRLVRNVPVLRLDARGLGIRSGGGETFRVTPWDQIAGIAWKNDDEIGVRLVPGEDGIADVLSVPLGLRGATAGDVHRAIDDWLEPQAST